MSEQPNLLEPNISPPRAKRRDFKIIFFVIILCFVSSLLLSVIAFTLKEAQDVAKELDRSKQMLIAAKILTHDGVFLLTDAEGKSESARFDPSKKQLVKEEKQPPEKATTEQIKAIGEIRIRPLLSDNQGNTYTLKEKNIDLDDYLSTNKKAGYAAQPLKLFYVVLPNEMKEIPSEDTKQFKDVYAYVFPVSGFGLWAPIYGYIALAPDADRVVGTSWYEHAETPGLGANIVEAWWQNQFFGKLIFQEPSSGKTDFQSAPVGIIVVKGKVQDVFGSSPKAKSAVDGISGATLTGDGVTAAYQNSLSPYRKLLIQLHKNSEKTVQGESA